MSYWTERYKSEAEVIVTEKKNGFVVQRWLDAVKGLNVGHALYRARKNWEGLEVCLKDY